MHSRWTFLALVLCLALAAALRDLGAGRSARTRARPAAELGALRESEPGPAPDEAAPAGAPRQVAILARLADGRPAAQVEVRLHGTGGLLLRAHTDLDGRASLAAPRTALTLTAVRADLELAAVVRAGREEPVFATVELDAEAERAELVLRARTEVRLEIVDAATGEPIECASGGATFRGGPFDGRTLALEAVRDDESEPLAGLYRAVGPAGPEVPEQAFASVAIEVAAPGFALRRLERAWARHSVDGAELAGVFERLELSDAPGALRIRGVLRYEGAALEREHLSARQWTERAGQPALIEAWRGRTDREGRFEFPCLAASEGDLVAVALARPVGASPVLALAGPLPVAAAAARELALAVTPWRGLAGVVYGVEPGVRYRQVLSVVEYGLPLELYARNLPNPEDGSPVAITVFVPSDPRRAFQVSVGLAQQTFEGFAPLARTLWSDALDYDGSQAGPLELTVRDTLTLAGRVAGLADAGWRKHAVYLAEPESQQTLQIGLLDAEGRFALRGLLPGSYRVAVAPMSDPWRAPLAEREIALAADWLDLEFAVGGAAGR